MSWPAPPRPRSPGRQRGEAGGGRRLIRAGLLAFALLLGAAATAVGQGSGAGAGARPDSTTSNAGARPETTARGGGTAAKDTVRAPDLREQVLQKLRTLEAASRPVPPKTDSAASKAAGDTAQADAQAGVQAGVQAGGEAGRAAVDSLVRRGAVDTLAGQAPADSLAGEVPRAPTMAPVAGAAPGAGFGAGAPFSGVIPGSDSVLARLRALEGYVVTEYKAANARFDGESGRLDLIGEPHLVRGTESMKADSLLHYDQRTSIVCGYGKPVLTGTGSDPVASEEVCYDVDRQVGVAMGARTTFTQQGTWYVHGTELYTAGTNRLYGSATSFTSCDLDEPHYHFSASQLKVVHEQVMVARNVTIKFGDVPVFWLPFLIQSLKPDRRSGLLTPTLGLQHVVRTSSGYRREIRDIGIYWALNEHLGLTTAMDWQSGGYLALRGELQYRWLRQFLGGSFSFSRYWMAEGNTNFALSGNTNWQPGERTRLQASVNYSSSSDLIRRYSMDPEELNRTISSTMGASHQFGWGNLSLNGSRVQQLSNDHVDLTFPSVSLTLNPITLFAANGESRWYNNATWQNDVSFSARSREVNYLLPNERGQNTASLQGSLNSRLSLGKLGWNGQFTFDENVLQDRPTWYGPQRSDTLPPDSLVYRRSVGQSMGWSTRLSFTQRLIENTHFTPSVLFTGGLRMPPPDSLGVTYGRVELPTRLSVGAELRTNIFGFWPGVGPYSRIRHRLEPSLSYSYSPAPTVTDLQHRAFGTAYDALRERNEIQLNFSQTFEAKPVARDEPAGGEAAGAAEDTVAGAFGEAPPRRLSQTQPITLLAINSSVLAYDFVRVREGKYGLTTTDMNHSIRSDLVRGLTLSIGHDLFRIEPGGEGARELRSFSPRLRNVDARFSLSSESWPFRLLRRGDEAEALEEGADKSGEAAADSLAADDQSDYSGSIIPGNRGRARSEYRGNQAVGTWRGDFGYSLIRLPAGTAGMGNSMLRVGLAFQPTENWNVSWNTNYSFTNKEFADHYLSLTRDLHRWRASFNFSRTQFGSFAFRFNVQLLDNPDIKVDYDQRSQAPPTQYR